MIACMKQFYFHPRNFSQLSCKLIKIITLPHLIAFPISLSISHSISHLISHSISF